MLTGSVLLDAAALVLAVGVVGGLGLLVWRRGFQSLTVRGPGGLEIDLQAIQRIESKVDQVNRVVNHQPADAPAIPQRLAVLERDMRHVRTAMTAVVTHLGIDIPEDQ